MDFDSSHWYLLTTALRWGASLFDWITRRRRPTPSTEDTPRRGRHRRDRRYR